MSKMNNAIAGILILLFCLTLVLPVDVVVDQSHNQTATIKPDGMSLADGESENLIIPVWKNEQVLNSSPDTNYHGQFAPLGGLWVGVDGVSNLARSYVSFDLTGLSAEIGFVSAHLHAFMVGEFSENDTAIGVFSCSDDLWDETLITWNTQPSSSASPTDVIGSPASPDMFVASRWYSWDITSDVRQALDGDRLLTELIRNIDENAEPGSALGFAKQEYDQFNATYISLTYTTPEVSQLAVDGHSSAPLIEYIQDSTPIMSWTHEDQDNGDVQYGYEVQVWDNPVFDGTNLYSSSSTTIQPVFYQNSSIIGRPFRTDDEVRFQFKYDSSILNMSGRVDKLHFYVVEDEGTLTFENLVVRMASTSLVGALGASFEANFGTASPVTVLSRDSYDAPIHNSILTFDVENTFVMSHDLSLIIEIRFMGLSGDLAWSEIDASSSVGWVAYEYGAGEYTATTASYLYTRCHSMDIEFASSTIFQTVASAGSNSYPFSTADGEAGRVAFKYNNSLISKAGYIDKLYFRVTPGGTDIVFDDFEVFLCETPVEGRLANGTWTVNYGGEEPTRVLNRASYTVKNLGALVVIDVDNSFYFNNEMNLLIELIWGSKVSGSATCKNTLNEGGYRAYDVISALPSEGNDTSTYHVYLDFIQSVNEIEYAGLTLTNATTYYWRVRTCDSTGIWTSWHDQSFKYEALESGPAWEDLLVRPAPVPLGRDVEVSINVTYFLGINEVVIEYDGSNHTMTNVGDTYSYSWTPDAIGEVNFTIYMESAVGTWNVVDSSFMVSSGLDIMLIAIIGGGVVIVLLIGVTLMKKKKSK